VPISALGHYAFLLLLFVPPVGTQQWGSPHLHPSHCHLACAIGRCLGCIGEPCHCCNVSSSLGSSPVRLACDPPPILSPIHLLKTISPQCVVLEDSSFSARVLHFLLATKNAPNTLVTLTNDAIGDIHVGYSDEMVFPLCLSKESFP